MTPEDLAELDRERRDADVRYNDALTSLDRAIVAAGGEPSSAEVDRTTTALLVFLQQITAFVESKDRQLAAESLSRIEGLEVSWVLPGHGTPWHGSPRDLVTAVRSAAA